MGRRLIASLVCVAALLAPAAAADALTTKLGINNAGPQGMLSRGEAIYVIAERFIPRRVCKARVKFTFTDKSGKKFKLASLKPKFPGYAPEGEADGNIGRVPSDAAFGDGKLRSKQKCRVGSASGKTNVYVPPPEKPKVTALTANDGVSGEVVRSTFSVDRRTRVAIIIDYELVPGEWRTISTPVNGKWLKKAGLYTFDWRASVGQPVPAGHYRISVETRSVPKNYGQEPQTFDRRSEDFFIAEQVGRGLFSQLVDGSLDVGGRLIVPDREQNNLRVFGSDGGLQATLAPPLSEPKDVAVSPDDATIYVADSGNRRVALVNRSGALVGSFGSGGSGPGQFSSSQGPQGIAATGLNGGRIYVTDGDLARIQAFDLGGALKETISGGNLDDPFSPAVAADGSIWVADAGTNRLLRFSAGGAQLASLPFTRPFGVDVAPGRVIYADNQDREAVVLSPEGAPLARVGKAFLGAPSGIAAAGLAGDFYVIDGGADAVFRFRMP